MIHYKRGGKWHFINIFLMRGSLFPQSFVMAGPCALLSFLLKLYSLFGEESVLLNASAWSGFSSLVGFLVVFRTSEAYSRFWDGCTATHQMRAEWIDAATAIMSFCKYSTAPEEDIMTFQHLAVRLFSLLHAMALGEIEECKDLEDVMAFNLELIDPHGLDKESWRSLKACHNKVLLVFTWLMTIIVEALKTGVLTIPPPILSRVFQELANGMVALHEAQKISTYPFPFPYAQTCDFLLFLHWIVTPVVTAQWSSNPWAAAVFGFVQVFILWSLNNIAVEIEHPFGNDANDLDAAQMQLDMNMSLLLVLHPMSTRAPKLSTEARLDGLVKMGRKGSQVLIRAETASYNTVIHSGFAEDSFWTTGLTDSTSPNGQPPGQTGGSHAPRAPAAPSAGGGDAGPRGDGHARLEAGPVAPPAGLALDGHAVPLARLELGCSFPALPTQSNDLGSAPVWGTPWHTADLQLHEGAEQPLSQAPPASMGFSQSRRLPPQCFLQPETERMIIGDERPPSTTGSSTPSLC